MSKVKITQVKSIIDRPQKQKATIQALGLKRMNHSVEVENSAQIQGMIKKVEHLIKVEEL